MLLKTKVKNSFSYFKPVLLLRTMPAPMTSMSDEESESEDQFETTTSSSTRGRRITAETWVPALSLPSRSTTIRRAWMSQEHFCRLSHLEQVIASQVTQTYEGHRQLMDAVHAYLNMLYEEERESDAINRDTQTISFNRLRNALSETVHDISTSNSSQ